MTIEPDFSKGNGLVPVIVQDCRTREVLMLAYMNAESWRRTLATGMASYWSRSRNRLWVKGEESGNTQLVREIMIDCDNDAILLVVEQHGGAACHTGYRSCFFRRLEPDGGCTIVSERIFEPQDVYK